ncbi:iron-siderophore ABC transporter substrate-binding protein [Scytonema sp. NUACC26]|uniref:iron-siderophore ABC transporter substrate-binding protein n=1 Tax=Scytonema sp. NUACC26 TaxID=3140176 RepID=UPI0034DBD26B
MNKAETLRLKLVGLLALAILSSCTREIHKLTDSSWNRSAIASSQVAVTMSETEIPLHPQRIVAIHWYAAEVATALGVKLIGLPRGSLILFDPQRKLGNIPDVGWPVNIEKVLALKPDLILGSLGWYKDTQHLWSKIAPTFLDSLSDRGKWKQSFTQLAQVLGKTQEAEEVIARYNARINEFKEKMGSRLKTTKVSVVQITPGTISLLGKKDFSGVIIEDVGLERPKSQNLDEKAALKLGVKPQMYPLSAELLPQMDADFLFVTTSLSKGKTESDRLLKQLTTVPLWSKLKAVQNSKVHVVGEYWHAGSYLAADRVLDDLFRYLLLE